MEIFMSNIFYDLQCDYCFVWQSVDDPASKKNEMLIYSQECIGCKRIIKFKSKNLEVDSDKEFFVYELVL